MDSGRALAGIWAEPGLACQHPGIHTCTGPTRWRPGGDLYDWCPPAGRLLPSLLLVGALQGSVVPDSALNPAQGPWPGTRAFRLPAAFPLPRVAHSLAVMSLNHNSHPPPPALDLVFCTSKPGCDGFGHSHSSSGERYAAHMQYWPPGGAVGRGARVRGEAGQPSMATGCRWRWPAPPPQSPTCRCPPASLLTPACSRCPHLQFHILWALP